MQLVDSSIKNLGVAIVIGDVRVLAAQTLNLASGVCSRPNLLAVIYSWRTLWQLLGIVLRSPALAETVKKQLKSFTPTATAESASEACALQALSIQYAHQQLHHGGAGGGWVGAGPPRWQKASRPTHAPAS